MNRCLSSRQRAVVRPFEELYHEMDGLLQGFLSSGVREPRSAGFVPQINIAETDTQFEVTADLPGVSADDVDVEVHEGQLILSGKREGVTEQSEKKFHRVERRHGEFRRVINLPLEVDEDKITADYSDGVLVVVLPKREKPKPTRVEVKTGATS